MLNEQEKADIRTACGYHEFHTQTSGFQNWRRYLALGILECRMNGLSDAEQAVVRRYLSTLGAEEKPELIDDWRRRMCAFLGVAPGPELMPEVAK